ncbi:MAG TPA: DUF2867 domain-containing protein [Solirubrobacteraceae bacterium]
MDVALRRVDFADAHAVALLAGASSDAREWHRALFASARPSLLMRARNAAVAPFGLHAPRGAFPVLSACAREVVVGLDDRHLDFRAQLRCADGVLSLVTSVEFHGLLGRAYFLPVRLIHPILVRRLLRRARSQHV